MDQMKAQSLGNHQTLSAFPFLSMILLKSYLIIQGLCTWIKNDWCLREHFYVGSHILYHAPEKKWIYMWGGGDK